MLAVLTLPGMFAGEADHLEGLLEAGVSRLHLRKPAAGEGELEGLLRRLAPRWSERLVLHGGRELALRYGIPNVHGSVEYRGGRGRSGGGPFVGGDPDGLTLSTSVHNWEEFASLPDGLAYAFISPVFDSISKAGYMANAELSREPKSDGRPSQGGASGPTGGKLPCLPVGLGGVNAETLRELIRLEWRGAAVLGWIWEEPRESVRRFEQLKRVIDE
jgi:thiamine monophosphate synthase